MRALPPFITLCVFLCGCAHVATQREAGLPCRCRELAKVPDLQPQRPTSRADFLELIVAASTYRASYNLPDAIQRLKPLVVYSDYRGNLVIALQRDGHEERGYYIVPGTSSSSVTDTSGEGWILKPIDHRIYEYVVRR